MDNDDPFQTHNHNLNEAPRYKPPRARGIRRGEEQPPLLLLSCVPLCLFLLVALVFMLLWHVPGTSVTVALACFIGSVLTTGQSSTATKDSPSALRDTFPLAMCLFGVVLGTMSGVYAYEALTAQFYSAALGQSYSRVLACSPAAAYADAGKIHFADSSEVNVTMSLGFQNRNTYCVAPIVDNSSAQTRRIDFWAVGINCCESGNKFECGSTRKSVAKGGIRAPPDGFFIKSGQEFKHAIEQASAIHNLVVEKDPILLAWDADPTLGQNASLLAAIGVVILHAALFALFTFAVLAATVLLSGTARGSGLPK